MRYELLKDSAAGVIIDPTPILRDVKDTFAVSFLLPFTGAFIALFRGEDNVERKALIKDEVAKIPKELLTKEQKVGLVVCHIDGDRILQAWECQPLRIGAFLYLRQTQWQVTAGTDDKDIITRFSELERIHAQTLSDIAALKAAASQHRNETAQLVAEFRLELYKRTEALASLQKDYESLVAALKVMSGNQAILQDNIKRLSATVESLK